MITTNDVLSWVLQYACRHDMFRFVQAIHKKFGELSQFNVCQLDISTALLQSIICQRDTDHFKLALRVLESLWQHLPQQDVEKTYGKLVFGFKSLIVMEMIKNHGSHALLELNSYFPRTTANKANTQNGEDIINIETTMKFRQKCLKLLAHQGMRDDFFASQYCLQFGDSYYKTMQQSLRRVLRQIRSKMPETVIDRVLQKGSKHFVTLLEIYPCVAMEMLLDVVHGRKQLSEDNLFELLNMLAPTDSQMVSAPGLMFSNTQISTDVSSTSLDEYSPLTCRSDNNSGESAEDHSKVCKDDAKHLYISNKQDEDHMSSDNTNEGGSDNQAHNLGDNLENNEGGSDDKVGNLGDNLETSTGSCMSIVISSGDSVSLLNKPSTSHVRYKHQDQRDKVVIVISSEENEQSHDPTKSESHELMVSLSETPSGTHLIQGQENTDQEINMSHDLPNDPLDDACITNNGDLENSYSSAIVPPSDCEQLEISDVFELDALPSDMLPSIEIHKQRSEVKMCVVKLFRNKALERYLNETTGTKIPMFD